MFRIDFLKKRDLLFVGGILLFAFVLLAWNSSHSGDCIAVVEKEGQVTMRIDLSSLTEPETFELGGKYNVVLLAEPGAICFASSECPDQICVNTGVLTKPGQCAVCMPARISVRLEGKQNSFDGYTG